MDGFYEWNVTYGSMIGRVKFSCRSLFDLDTSPMGLGLELGEGLWNHTTLSKNQSIIGFDVYYDTLGIHAISFEYT